MGAHPDAPRTGRRVDLCHAGSPPDDQTLRARLNELRRPKLWLALAATVHCLREQSIDPRWAMHAPNRKRLTEHADALELIAARLADTPNPPAPRGVAVVIRLLTQGDGPLYNPAWPLELRTTLSNCGQVSGWTGHPSEFRTLDRAQPPLLHC